MSTKSMASLFQLPPQHLKVVNLSIENQNVAAVLGMHGLMSLFGQVKDSQTPMSQRHAGFRTYPGAFVIRASMRQRRRHASNDKFAFARIPASRRLNKACYPAHTSALGSSDLWWPLCQLHNFSSKRIKNCDTRGWLQSHDE